jgi:hypothetical protein
VGTKMVRKQFYIHKRQNDLLKRLAQTRGVSEAEIIRQAIDHEISGGAAPKPAPSLTAMDEFVELALQRRSLGIEGEPLRWNREEIYEERENRWIRPSTPD